MSRLLDFLKTQRWFAAKSGAPSNARIVDKVVLPWGEIARVAVDVNGAEQLYQVPLVPGDEIRDATSDEAFRRGLVDALAAGAVTESNGVRWIAEPNAPADVSGATRVGSAEQSNTSIVAGDRAIVKLFRLLKPGVHPDVEVTRFLTHAGFANTPRLLGEARFEDATGTYTAAMMQEYVVGSRDAWSHALDVGAKYFGAPKGREDPSNFIRDAKQLGTVTRAMHDALASDDDDPAFAPEEIVAEDLDRWAHRAQQMVREAITLLEKALAAGTLPKERQAEAQALVRRRDHYLGWINEIDDQLGDDVGLKTRTHGDYHLGQVLRAPSGELMIIDFEGEPSRSLEERREKTSPLRDVAGMLRSVAYAAATLSTSVEKQQDLPTRELRSARWERDVRAAFLDGYLTSSDDDDGGYLPEDPKHVQLLIGLFETEKAFYELAYELNNRPAWAWIPMRGISKLLTVAR